MKHLSHRKQAAVLLIALALSACSKKAPPAQAPILQDSKVTQTGMRPTLAPGSSLSASIRVEATVDRQALLSQEFFYSCDLQYSTIYDKSMDLTNQSLAVGLQIARFRISGDELQLVADHKIHSKSDINHPEQLLSRFKILSQTDQTLTISGADSRATLSQIMAAIAAKAPENAQDLWIRSFEFVADGNYLLQQTSVMLADGTIGEFMEAIFPRESMKPSPNFEAFPMDPEHPVGADDGVVARYRLLNGDKVYDGEQALSHAQHFDLPEGGTIDWYATRNIPDEMLAPVGDAIEGWNRYFLTFKGIERKVMNFKGRLPEGIHIGDPRYNVVNWDSRLVAGAAYESQDSDPLTGKQSHSMIYLPAAWVMIGMDYWKKGQFSEAENSSSLLKPAKPSARREKSRKAACSRDLREAAALMASGRIALESQDAFVKFGIQLLKQTLFHEVGHALGLAHNFKGSLSFDRADPESLFSSSIMDYNGFDIERAAFFDVNSSDGPVLEYDRQTLSALYNGARDVSDEDPWMPACNDAEADSEAGGVDPLCVRYDVEYDPTLSIESAFKRLTQASIAGDVTLAQAIGRVPGMLAAANAGDGIKTREEFLLSASQVIGSFKGTLAYYYTAGYASFAKVIRNNIRSLLMVADGVLPEDYNAATMRSRVLKGVQHALAMNELSVAVKQALVEAEKMTVMQLAQSTYIQSLPADEGAALMKKVAAKVISSIASFETDPTGGLAKARATVFASLARHGEVPFFFGMQEEASLDIEGTFAQVLGDAVPADGARTLSERIQAAQALVTFAGRPPGDVAIARALTKLQLERGQARDNESREVVEALIGLLKSASR